MIGYDCEGCGIHVHLFGDERVPVSQLCATCAHISEFADDLLEMMQMHDRLNRDMKGER